MRKIGIHLSYWQTGWKDDLRPLIGKAHQAGFEVAEFPMLFPTELDYHSLRAELDHLGMGASCSTGLGTTTDITSPDAAIRKAGLDHLIACLNGAVELGSPVLVGVTYAPWGLFPEDDWSVRRDRAVDSLKVAAQMADDKGVLLCMEVLNRFEGYLVNTVEQGLEMIADVDSQSLKLHLDTFHLNIEADNIGDEIRRAGSQLGHMHCVENNRKVPGEGHIPWPEVKAALDDIDYQGYIVAETFVNPAGEVGRGLFIWRPLADHLDAAASRAAVFLKRNFTYD